VGLYLHSSIPLNSISRSYIGQEPEEGNTYRLCVLLAYFLVFKKLIESYEITLLPVYTSQRLKAEIVEPEETTIAGQRLKNISYMFSVLLVSHKILLHAQGK
jgi:hypothetical protein